MLAAEGWLSHRARDGARFWARIVAHVAEARGTSDVDELVAAFPRLLDPKLPQSHGSAHALERGRGAWVEPDLRALPA